MDIADCTIFHLDSRGMCRGRTETAERRSRHWQQQRSEQKVLYSFQLLNTSEVETCASQSPRKTSAFPSSHGASAGYNALFDDVLGPAFFPTHLPSPHTPSHGASADTSRTVLSLSSKCVRTRLPYIPFSVAAVHQFPRSLSGSVALFELCISSSLQILLLLLLLNALSVLLRQRSLLDHQAHYFI